MIEAVFFDMDGTLLDIDFGGFLNAYMKAAVARFHDVGPAEEVARQLVASTVAMIQNKEPGRTILDAFIDDFFPALGLPKEEIQRFMAFYREDYPALHYWARPMDGAREILQAAFDRGYKVAIATAPLFPREAIWERLRWGKVDDFPYDFVAGADVLHIAKPFPGYYLEIAEKLGVVPEACLMIGDEREMDGHAARVGMRTLLVGPDRPSNMELWFAGQVPAPEAQVPRYPDLHELRRALQEEGIL